MEPHENPLDDPEAAEEMRKRGIVHKSGMAAELMEEIAPLLKAEGIDLDDPDVDLDHDALNAAMSRAVEQHNLGLFTPVATQREQVEQLLAEFADASTAKNLRAAEEILDSVEPEPTAHRPAVSHVIGASLGLLDTWYTDAQLRVLLSDVRVPKWRGPARSIASRLIRAAQSGDAYASLDELIVRHGGLLVFQAGVLAVAGTIHSFANVRRTSVPDAAQYLLGPSATRAPGHTGEAFGLAPAADEFAQDLFEAFAAWLYERGDAAEFADVQRRVLENVFEMADVLEFDLRRPSGVLEFANRMESWEDEGVAETVLTSLDTYLHFRIETAEYPAPWEQVHEATGPLPHDSSPEGQETAEVMAAVDALSNDDRRRALNEVRVVNAVFPLLGWLGKGQATTPASGVRRAEIKTVASMIGVTARGTAERAAQTETLDLEFADERESLETGASNVNSIKDVPQLHAWWEALKFAEIIVRQGNRIRPGEYAQEFTDGELPPLETSEILASTFIAELLAQELKRRPKGLSTMVVFFLVERLRAAAADRRVDEKVDLSQWREMIASRATPILEMIESTGLVEGSGDELAVPPALRGAVLKGAIMALALLGEGDVLDN